MFCLLVCFNTVNTTVSKQESFHSLACLLSCSLCKSSHGYYTTINLLNYLLATRNTAVFFNVGIPPISTTSRRYYPTFAGLSVPHCHSRQHHGCCCCWCCFCRPFPLSCCCMDVGEDASRSICQSYAIQYKCCRADRRTLGGKML